jgi:hypothetical protein
MSGQILAVVTLWEGGPCEHPVGDWLILVAGLNAVERDILPLPGIDPQQSTP